MYLIFHLLPSGNNVCTLNNQVLVLDSFYDHKRFNLTIINNCLKTHGTFAQ